MHKIAVTLAVAVSLILTNACSDHRNIAERMDLGKYPVFVGNWSPDNQPFCAAIQTAQQWKAVMHPAATMFGSNVFGPPDRFWVDHAVLLVAYAVNGADADGFGQATARIGSDQIEVNYTLSHRGHAGFSVKTYLAFAVPKPIRSKIVFTESGKQVCSLNLRTGRWAHPSVGLRE